MSFFRFSVFKGKNIDFYYVISMIAFNSNNKLILNDKY